MTYSIVFSEKARKQIKKLDPMTAKLIAGWLRKNLEGCTDPRAHGKALTANRRNQWRYRIGDYRVIADIQDDKILILVLEIGHRRDVYK